VGALKGGVSYIKVCGKDVRVQGRLIRIARLDGDWYEFLDNQESAIATYAKAGWHRPGIQREAEVWALLCRSKPKQPQDQVPKRGWLYQESFVIRDSVKGCNGLDCVAIELLDLP
jgi:hypothetical protein